MIKLELIRNDLESNLRKLFGDTFDSNFTSIECNITQKVAGENTVDQTLDLLNKSYTEGTNVVYQRASTRCKYLKERETLIVRVKNYYVLKAYNKSLEQWKNGNKDIEDGVLRIEIVMHNRVISKLFGEKKSISDVLQRKSLEKVMEEYKRIFVDDVINKHIKPCLTDIRKILTQSLLDTDNPVDTIAMKRSLIVDEDVLREALRKWYEMRGLQDNSRQALHKLKKYDLPKDVIKTISEFRKSCG